MALSNPGKKYANTRHNIGLNFLEFYGRKKKLNFTKKHSLMMAESDKFILIKSSSFMNLSGNNLKKAQRAFGKIPVENVLVCADNLDLDIGKCRIKNGGSPQ